MSLTDSFPKQRLSYKEKIKDNYAWTKNMIDTLVLNYAEANMNISDIRNHTGYRYKNDYQRKLANYQLYNNIINQEDFEKELNPLGIQVGQFKDEIMPYNKAYNKIQVLLGEELKRPFDFVTAITNEDGIRQKHIEQIQQIHSYIENILSEVRNTISQNINPEQGELTPEQEQQMNQQIDELLKKYLDPAEMDKALNTTYLHSKERTALRILKYLLLKEDILDKKNDSFKHALLAGEQITWVGIRNNEPVVEVINPLGFFYHKSPEVKQIEYGLYAGYRTMMNSGDILDNFGEYLSEDDIKKIEGTLHGVRGFRTKLDKTMKYDHYDITYEYTRKLMDNATHEGSYGTTSNISEDWLVHHVEWRSQRKVYFLSYVNQYGDEEMDIVSEDFVIPEYAEKKVEIRDYGKKKTVWYFDGYRAEEAWIPDVWTGIRIGDDIYCCMGRKPYQFRSIDNPYKVKLGYHGTVYSNMNAAPISLMDRIKPFQYLFFIIMHKLKQLIAKDKGQVFHFDVTMVDPKMGLEKTLYYLEQLDIDFYNPLHNAEIAGAYQRGKITGATSRSNMQHILSYVNLLAAIDEQISDVAGVTRQREGMSTPYEAVTNHQQAIVQSTHITEIYFQTHAKHWENVLNSLVQTAQECWKNKGIVRQYVLDDLSIETLNVEPSDLTNADIGVFITNSRKENEVFEQLKGLAQYMIANDKAKLSDVIKLFKSSSVSEVERELKRSEREMEKAAQEQAQREQEMLEQQIQAQKEAEERKFAHEKEMLEMENANRLKEKEMDVFKFQRDLDTNRDSIPDHLQIEELRDKNQIAREKIALDREKMKTEASLKEKEIAAKKNTPSSK